ncbi:MAG: AAA family ATPase, partial [Pseudomonadota bacterium]
MVISTYLDRIKLSAFRNYGQLGLSLDGRHVVLSGPNGSGKTNLIEAVSLLSPGRGLRRASAAQMIHKDGASE